MARPDNLPDFEAPPIHEVVLGIQFNTPPGYQQIHAGEVWNLFRADYPKVAEQQALPPAFETFGAAGPKRVSLGFIAGASHDRFWFLSKDESELIQFQSDRLLHNWRKVGDQLNPYPRFETMMPKFEVEMRELENYFMSLASQPLQINQCEITYINHIRFVGEELSPAFWLRLFAHAGEAPPEFSASFRWVIKDTDGKPQGRLICETATDLNRQGEQIISLRLTARGVPKGTDIAAASVFIKSGRDLVVNKFAEVTTPEAQKKWKRVK